MGTNDLPNDSQNTPDSDSSDRTLSAGGPGGAAAGQIGPYRLLQVLGEGGMGEVWLAEQKSPIHRTVALKLIKAGMDTKAVVARFESERQALALMDHPNIAQVYEAGSTPEGRPYFVMEYVPGLPITEYCDKHRLTMKERLELFKQVCDGVQHAHQKAIIHRDLKPSNVLVEEQDGKAAPKIIDFGLAKATGQRLTDKTMFTELGVLIGTPEYMSPEQADQREQNIDTRTDVYSLGVILYELLVGVLPFETKALRAAGLDAVLRVIREVEPPKPSTKIRSMGDGSTAAAEKRREEPRTFARHLQGELDWITMKALEKDRARRYGTPSEFAADISRYLRSEPVLAGPTTAGYRIKKYASRHRIGLAAGAGVLLLVIGFVITQAIELHRIRLERDRANRERDSAARESDRANRITDFMTGMFKVSDPGEARGKSITAREILDKASKNIDKGLGSDPLLQSQLMDSMGTVYLNLGIHKQAESLYSREIEIELRTQGPKSAVVFRSKLNLANVLYDEGRFAGAEKLDREAVDDFTRTLGPEHLDTLTAKSNLANALNALGRFAEAESLNREVLKERRGALGPDDLDTLRSAGGLGLVTFNEGRYEEAEKLDREAFDGFTRVLGPDHPDTLTSESNLAIVLNAEGRSADAEKDFREVLDMRRRVLGQEHLDTLGSVDNLAMVLSSEARYAESEKLFRKNLYTYRRVFGAEHPRTMVTMGNLASVLMDERHYRESESLLRQSLSMQRRVLGPEHPDVAFTTYNLACVELKEGRRDDALSLLGQAIDHGLVPYADLGMDQDPDLKSLHGDPRFEALVAHAKEKGAVGSAAQKRN
jgi:serine/threonine protein kinase